MNEKDSERSLQGSCHCGAVRLTLPAAPEKATSCNCSLCRRSGAIFGYYEFGTVAVQGHPENTEQYVWGDRTLVNVRCKTCGIATHWEPIDSKPGARHGVNLRNFDPRLLESAVVRRFDGANTWTFLDDASTRDRNGAVVSAGTSVRILSIDASILSALDDEQRQRVSSMQGEVVVVHEVDQWGAAWVKKWWRDRDDEGGDICHSLGLRPQEMEVVDARAEVEVVARFYAAINRNDIQAITKDFDPQIVRIEPEGFPTAGTYRGIAAVQEHVRKGRGTWAEGTCEPEKFLVNADKVVVYLHAWVRLHGATDWTGGRFADGFVFREGKIVEYLSFGERADALKWAGIEDPSTAG